MNKAFFTIAAASALAVAPAHAATMTFSGIPEFIVAQPTYTEAGITATSIDGNFWGYPTGQQLYLEPSSWGISTYDFTFSGGLFDLIGLSVADATGGAVGTFTAFDAGSQVIGTSVFSGASNGAQTFSLTGITRLRLVASGSDFSIDNLVLNATKGAVPEPATWAMMLVGFGMVGYTVRRRRVGYAAIAA